MKTIHCLSVLALAFTLVGCAGVNTTSSTRAQSHPDLPALGHYHAMLIEPVVFQPAATARLLPAEQIKLGEVFGRRARETFATRYTIATVSAPGTLRLRLSVDDINKSSRVANLLSAAVAFVPLDMGAIVAEMIVEDSVTGRRLATLTGRRRGSPLGREGFFASFRPTGHAQAGFDQLVQNLLKVLTEPATLAEEKPEEQPPIARPLV